MSKSVFNSFNELKNESLQSHIIFYHGLSELAFERLNQQTKSFFMENAGFVDSRGNPGPNIKLYNNLAIDTISEFGESKNGPIFIGQDISTKKFFALKPIEIDNSSGITEINILKQLERFQEVIPHHEHQNLKFLCMDFIDGVTFKDIKQISAKINDAARYLISFNLVKEFKFFQEHRVIQEDKNFGNFMIDVRNFDVKIIDYERCTISTDPDPFILNVAGLFDCVFSTVASRRGEYNHKMDKYADGTFKEFLTKIISSDDTNGNFLSNIVGALPFDSDSDPET